MKRLRLQHGHYGCCPLLLVVALLGSPFVATADDSDPRGWGDPCRSPDRERSAAIHQLYEQRDRAPVWLTLHGRNHAGRQLVHLLRNADDAVITECLAQALDGDDQQYSRGQLDVMLTDAYLELSERGLDQEADFAEHLAVLVPGEQQQRQRRLERLAAANEATPDDAATTTATSASARMEAALKRYRRIVEAGGWPRIEPGPALDPGSDDHRVPALRERLAATGDLSLGAQERTGSTYGPALVEAVTLFQQRHGLEPDGVVGSATREALNVPAAQRVAQMAMNLRRIQDREIDKPGPVVRVNIPDFRVSLHEGGRITFSTRAIVGEPQHATPPMEQQISGLTLNPAWNVPQSVVREDLAHRFAEDSGYARRNGFHALGGERTLAEVDWSRQPGVAVRQDPGPTNALGRLKFEMPNRRAIYLHDTPHKHLFEARQRTFSAGCVRVEEPMELAARIAGFGRDGAQRLERQARDGKTRTLRLGRRVPVQIVYFTAWVDSYGRVQFRPDIYDRDDYTMAEGSAG